jgi:adenosylhomocysteine nucleosidase
LSGAAETRPHPAASARVAAVTGLRAEARLAARGLWRVGCAGGDAAATRAELGRLVAAGATLLVSFGIAGGLDPALAPGTLVVADRVTGAAGAHPPPLIPAVAGARIGGVVGAAAPAATAAAKAALFRETGALAVDLESGLVAEAAARAGLPYAVLRAVADPAWRDLPPAACIPLRRDGTPDLAAVLLAVARRPGQIPALVSVARDMRAALATLARIDLAGLIASTAGSPP